METRPETLSDLTQETYYEILGISTTAAQEEIKKGFKRQALLHHPDKSQSQDSIKRFEEIQKAFAVLGDERKKGVYDRYGLKGLETLEQFGG